MLPERCDAVTSHCLVPVFGSFWNAHRVGQQLLMLGYTSRPSIAFELCKTPVRQGPGFTGAEQGGRKDYGFGLRTPFDSGVLRSHLLSAIFSQIPSPLCWVSALQGHSHPSWPYSVPGRLACTVCVNWLSWVGPKGVTSKR